MRFIYLLFFLCFIACNQPQSRNDLTPEKGSAGEKESAVFFPVTVFIQGQLSDIKNKGINPLKYSNINGKPDSVWLKAESFDEEFADFLSPPIDSLNMTCCFTEKKFFDQTLNFITLTYDRKIPDSDAIPWQRWDVYINPETNSVDKIYLVKKFDKDRIKQLTWNTGKNCKMVTINQNTSEKPFVENQVEIKLDY